MATYRRVGQEPRNPYVYLDGNTTGVINTESQTGQEIGLSFWKIIACVVGCLGASCGAIILFAIALITPFYMLLIGAIHVRQCQGEPMIPIFMIVCGAITIVRVILGDPGKSVQMPNSQSETAAFLQPRNRPWKRYIVYLIETIQFGWLIAGMIWTFSFTPDHNDRNSDQYCSRLLYGSAYVSTIVCLITFVVSTLFTICSVLAISVIIPFLNRYAQTATQPVA